jgi:hypothetical protein
MRVIGLEGLSQGGADKEEINIFLEFCKNKIGRLVACPGL